MGRPKLRNKILEHNDKWLLVDISTPKYPDATMAVDADVFEAHEGGRINGAQKNTWHKYITATYRKGPKTISFHRDVIDIPKGFECDHIKHGTMEHIDNRRSNLRSVTSSENNMNQSARSNSTSGIKGVCWHKTRGKWLANISINGKRKYIGYFDNIDFAIGARQQAERELFGEYKYEVKK